MFTFRDRAKDVEKKPNKPNILNVYFSFYYCYSICPYSGSFNIGLSCFMMQQKHCVAVAKRGLQTASCCFASAKQTKLP